MLGINGWEFIALLFLAVVILGPERLPEYAAKLAHGIRKLRVMSEGAKSQLKDQLGPEYADINWRQYDPRQYDPRRIVREALTEPLASATAPFRESLDDVTKGDFGVNPPVTDAAEPVAAAAGPSVRQRTPFDDDAT